MWRNNPAFNYEELKQYKKTKQKTATGRTETFEEWKDRLAREQDDLRVREGSKMERQERSKDMQQGVDFAKEQGLDDLGRSTDFADVRKTRDILNTRATEGLSDTEEEAIREKGMQQLQGSEQSQRRKLLSTQAQSGVRGGAAGQMQVELAAQAMNNRRALETDLILQDEQTKRAGEMNFGNFATQQAQFDLGQAAKEKLARAQSALAFAELGSNERSQIRQNIAAERAANAKKQKCFPAFTEVEMADGTKKAIADIKIGDKTKLGGTVTGVMSNLVNEQYYIYKGVYVTGSHAVLVGNTFVRVKDSSVAVISTKKAHVVHSINTENHLMLINGIIFSDFDETDLDVTDEQSLKILNKEVG